MGGVVVVVSPYSPWSTNKAKPQPDLLFSSSFRFVERMGWGETLESHFQAKDNVDLD